MAKNNKVINSFGEEWNKFDQSSLKLKELNKIFYDYFKIFPWGSINKNSVGFDMGCGSGRWAKIVAPKVKLAVANKVPDHFPKIKPAIKITGEPNPSSRTHIIVNKINKTETKK